MKEIAAELPLQVIAELMGIPLDDRHKLFDWSNRLIGFDDPEFPDVHHRRAAGSGGDVGLSQTSSPRSGKVRAVKIS